MKVTRRGYWEVRRGPLLVSRHAPLEEAFESASRSLPAVIVPPTYDVAADAPAPAPAPTAAVFRSFALPPIRMLTGG
jgi:hypothetical protein